MPPYLLDMYFSLLCRVDPHASTKDKETSPLEIAVEQDKFDLLIILLAGFAGTSSTKMKLEFMKMILENDGEKQYAPEFKKILEGLSSSEVGDKIMNQLLFHCCLGFGKAVAVALASYF